MSCPELAELLLAMEDGAGDAFDHAQSCPACQARLAAEADVAHAFDALAAPVPPSTLLTNVMAEVDSLAASRRQVRRQVAIALSLCGAVATAILAVFGRELFMGPALALVQGLAAARAVLAAGFDALSPGSHPLLMPVLAAQAALLLFCSFAVRRLMRVAESRS